MALAAGGWLVTSAAPTLSGDPVALARLDVPALAGTLERATAYAPDGRRIPLRERNGRLTPRVLLTPGELVAVDVVIRRPAWLSWALGGTRHVELRLRAPAVSVQAALLASHGAGAPLVVRFDGPVARLESASGTAHDVSAEALSGDRRSLTLTPESAAGSTEIVATARRWERAGAPITVSWFPAGNSSLPMLLASPDPAAPLAPGSGLRLTFSLPVATALGGALPTLAPTTAGSWSEPDSHTLLFTPSAPTGFPLATDVTVSLPDRVALQSASGTSVETNTVSWMVAAGSTLRLDELLAEQGLLPVLWTPSGAPVARTAAAQVAAALAPPAGSFAWRYPNTPSELTALWSPGEPNVVTRGAVMMFEQEHGLTVDGIAGPEVWQALIAAAIAGQFHSGYDYVYVHRRVPESLTLWSDGHIVLSSPGNTGIPSAPTQLGTFAVYEHIPVGRMSGTNPDGTKYNDPGVRYISYFNGGDALHAFPRASYGTPQSLGCVELPLAAAAQLWPYTPVGTLVTIEN